MISRNLSQYLLNQDISLKDSLKLLEKTNEKCLLIVNKKNKLIGTLTDGDIRRFLIKKKNPNLLTKVSDVCNKKPFFEYSDQTFNRDRNLDFKIHPIVNKQMIVVGLYKKSNDYIEFGDRQIGSNMPAFVIAEIGNNHNGDFKTAIKLIDLAIEAGADCVKFQMRHMDDVYRSKTLDNFSGDLSTEYTLDILDRFQLTEKEHKKVFDYCKEKEILYMCTPWDKKSVDILESYGIQAYKIASADLTNLSLIDYVSKTNKPLILSTGMSTREDTQKAVDFLNNRGSQFALLHCNSTYPAPFQDIHLKWIDSLKDLHFVIGYSGHERGTSVSIAAVTLGASIVERHFTLDKNMEGPDHAASLTPNEFKLLVDGIREVEMAMTKDGERSLSQGEMINRENLGKSLIASKNLKKGHVLKSSDILIRSPGQGLPPNQLDKLIGIKLKRNLKKEDFFFESDLSSEIKSLNEFSFNRPWGVPVRYHDFKIFDSIFKPDFFEFHLSYSDMELNIQDYFNQTYDYDFIVHAPELFMKSHLLDLATKDNDYRKISIDQMNRVCEITRSLKKYFPKTKKPLIVTNIGGFSRDGAIEDQNAKEELYEIFADSLEKLDMDGIEVIPQTMPPFPWHFGGQRYHNLFVLPDEIIHWCKKLDIRVCFDVSHSYLTCTNFGIDFYDFMKRIAPFSAHYHIADAKGLNGEGLQIDEGEIDFIKFFELMNQKSKDAPFIPEIWQGHKNNGLGFLDALNLLDRYSKSVKGNN